MTLQHPLAFSSPVLPLDVVWDIQPLEVLISQYWTNIQVCSEITLDTSFQRGEIPTGFV